LNHARALDDLDEIREGLRASVRHIAADLLGEPSSKTGSEWRWGKKGSMAVAVAGAKQGLWNDHEAGAGGDMLALIQRERGGDFTETVAHARALLGIGEATTWTRRERPARPDDTARREAAEADEAARRSFAQRLWAEAQPIAGSVAERYLVETREIPVPAGGWPQAVRFHPKRLALIVGATTSDGTVQAVQLVHLTADATKRAHEADRPTKQSFGPQQGAVVRLPGTKDALLLAEGPETGLSLWAATGRETWIALGSMAKVELPPLRQAVLCADDDKKDSPADKALRKAVSRWRNEARAISVALPWTPRRFDGTDFNDLLRDSGKNAVVQRIAIALQPQGPQPPGRSSLPMDMARYHLGKAVAEFFRQAADYDAEAEDAPAPIVQGIKVGVGIGKSHSARLEAARLLAALRALVALRAKGDRRTVIMAVPTHKLGAEQAVAFDALPEAQAAGLRAAVWRGREAADPDISGKAMCHDLDAVREVQGLGLSVEAAVCHRKPKGQPAVRCPFYEVCGYQRQKEAAADLWLVPHEILFGEKPAALGEPVAVIVDESIFRKGLVGVDGPPMELTLDALADDVSLPGKLATSFDSDRLRNIHAITAATLAKLKDGPLSRCALLAAGLNAETGKDGHRLSWLRVTDPGVLPGMDKERRRELLQEAGQNKTAIRLARFFSAMEALLQEGGPEASGWISLATNQTKEGPQRVIRLRGRSKVAKGFNVPTLHLDALLAPDLVRFYWPRLEVVAEIEARTPHMRIRQITGRDWAKSALVPDEYSTPAEGQRRLKNSERLRAAVWREARQAAGGVLVVAQKAVREYWETCGPMPANIDMAHHNAVAGRDSWGGVDRLVVVGRTLPPAHAVERMAEALTGAAVANKVTRYERRDAAVLLTDGTTIAAEADFHPDPVAEAIRWQICEGELIQIIGRGRAVNRTSATPLDVLVLTDRPISLAIDTPVTWEELMPSPFDLMLSQQGVALINAADASRGFPHLWENPENARKAFQRAARPGHSPIGDISIGECPGLRRARYQKVGARQKPADLVFDPSTVDDLHGWLEDRLGELAMLQVDGPPSPEPSPRAVEPAGSPGLPGKPESPSALQEPAPAPLMAASWPDSPLWADIPARPAVAAPGQLGGDLHPEAMGMRRVVRPPSSRFPIGVSLRSPQASCSQAPCSQYALPPPHPPDRHRAGAGVHEATL
jgi:putative DNA primase/helicase